jgi:hypothetical protein
MRRLYSALLGATFLSLGVVGCETDDNDDDMYDDDYRGDREVLSRDRDTFEDRERHRTWERDHDEWHEDHPHTDHDQDHGMHDPR